MFFYFVVSRFDPGPDGPYELLKESGIKVIISGVIFVDNKGGLVIDEINDLESISKSFKSSMLFLPSGDPVLDIRKKLGIIDATECRYGVRDVVITFKGDKDKIDIQALIPYKKTGRIGFQCSQCDNAQVYILELPDNLLDKIYSWIKP